MHCFEFAIFAIFPVKCKKFDNIYIILYENTSQTLSLATNRIAVQILHFAK